MKYLIAILFVFTVLISSGQTNHRPTWLGNQGKPISIYYDYYIGLGEDYNAQKGHEKAVADVISQISDEIKSEYQVTKDADLQINENTEQNNTEISSDFNLSVNIKSSGAKFIISGLREVESYQEGNRFYVLYRRPKNNIFIPEEAKQLYSYDNGHKWRSIIFPGWGQNYNGQREKSILMISTGALMATGIVASQTLYSINSNNYKNSLRKSDIENANIYKSNRDNCGLARNCFIVGFSAIYIYNLVDAFSSVANKKYSFEQPHIKFSPWYYKNAIGLNICFSLNPALQNESFKNNLDN